MSKVVQIRGGSSAEHTNFIGQLREITVDTDKKTLVVHDGVTQGGHELAKKSDIDSLNNNTTSVLEGKQEKLVSGVNLKTLGGESILGTGNIAVDSSMMSSMYATSLKFN